MEVDNGQSHPGLQSIAVSNKEILPEQRTSHGRRTHARSPTLGSPQRQCSVSPLTSIVP